MTPVSVLLELLPRTAAVSMAATTEHRGVQADVQRAVLTSTRRQMPVATCPTFARLARAALCDERYDDHSNRSLSFTLAFPPFQTYVILEDCAGTVVKVCVCVRTYDFKLSQGIAAPV